MQFCSPLLKILIDGALAQNSEITSGLCKLSDNLHRVSEKLKIPDHFLSAFEMNRVEINMERELVNVTPEQK